MLERRGDGRVYLYRCVRRDGRVVREYVASGAAALILAAEDEREREQARDRRRAGRERVRARIARLVWAEGRVVEACGRLDGAFAEAMAAAGFHKHKRQWRPRRRPGKGAAMAVPAAEQQQIRETVMDPQFQATLAEERARRLFEEAGPDVDRLIKHYGGKLPLEVRERLVRRLGADPNAREAVRREADRVRRELEGPAPTVVERLVAERAVIGWLHLAWCDRLAEAFADELERREVASHVDRIRARANRSYLHTLRSLELVRKAVAVGPVAAGGPGEP